MTASAFILALFVFSLISFALGCCTSDSAKALNEKTTLNTKKVKDWIGSRKPKLWWLIIIIPAIATAILIMYGYIVSVDFEPDNDDSWGNFGALLSGTFTFIASFAAIATLLEVNKQNKDQFENSNRQNKNLEEQLELQRKITNKQLNAITFDQYNNHRKVFFEQIINQEKIYLNNYTFENKEGLYNAIFRENSPTNCEYVIDCSDSRNVTLYKIRNLHKLSLRITEPPYKKDRVFNIINCILSLYNLLGLETSNDKKPGDIHKDFIHTGVNIYRLIDIVIILNDICHMIYFYTGNNVKKTPVAMEMSNLVDLNYCISSKLFNINDHPAFRIKRPKLHMEVEKLYCSIYETKKSFEEIKFIGTSLKLMQFFDLKAGFTNKNLTADAALQIALSCERDINMYKKIVNNDPEVIAKLDEIGNIADRLKNS